MKQASLKRLLGKVVRIFLDNKAADSVTGYLVDCDSTCVYIGSDPDNPADFSMVVSLDSFSIIEVLDSIADGHPIFEQIDTDKPGH